MKKVIYILFIVLLTSVQSKGQVAHSGLNGVVVKTITPYPNPCASQITFDFEQNFDKSYSLQIFNFVGKKVFESQSVTLKTVVDVSEFYRGMYIYRVKKSNGQILESGKFQVSH